MGPFEAAWRNGPTRRHAIAGLAGLVAGVRLGGVAPLAQRDPRPLSTHRRHPGLDEMVTAFDFEPLMFANVALSTYDYTAQGDGSEFTMRRNREAFEWIDIVPARTAVDPASVDLSSELLGAKLASPLLIAPTATQLPLHPDGESGMRRGAIAAANTPMILSHNTSITVENVAKAGAGTLWWQFYPQMNADTSREILTRAENAGCSAIVVTVDQTSSFYERSQQNVNLGGAPRGAGGGRGRGRGGAQAPTGAGRYRIGTNRLWYTWKTFDDIIASVKVPVLIKGIVSPEDARLAIEHGARAIAVSNHGGRSMDYGPSTLEALPAIVDAVKGRVPVLIDSGFRRGSDVFKALALGADGVLLGRVTRWALAAFGAAGVQRVLEIIQRELVEAAALAGCRTLADITPATVKANWP